MSVTKNNMGDNLYSTPLLPFDQVVAPRRRRHKSHRTTNASSLTFDEIKKRRGRQYLQILDILSEYGPYPPACLTARQLPRVMVERRNLPPGSERNAVSPALSELLDIGAVDNLIDPGQVDEKRNLRIFLKRVGDDFPASTWRASHKKDLSSWLTCGARLRARIEVRRKRFAREDWSRRGRGINHSTAKRSLQVHRSTAWSRQ